MNLKHLIYYSEWGDKHLTMLYCTKFDPEISALLKKDKKVYGVHTLELATCMECIKYYNALTYGTSDEILAEIIETNKI